MSIIFNKSSMDITDTRCPDDKILNGDKLSVCYTLLSDDITKGKKPSATPYTDRKDYFEASDNTFFAKNTKATLKVNDFLDGILLEINSPSKELSEFGVNLPFNFMGKLNGGGWKNQFLFNSPYTSPDKSVIYAFLTKPNGYNLLVAVLSRGQGWKMDYSPYGWGHFFINLKLLASYDKAFGLPKRDNYLRIAILPVTTFDDCLKKLSQAYDLPFIDYSVGGGKIGDAITLFNYGEADSLLEEYESKTVITDFCNKYTIKHEGEVTLIPIKKGKLGVPVTVYGYTDLASLYKKSMDSVDLNIIKKFTDGNLCEHQCWASAMLRFLKKNGATLTDNERLAYENKLSYFLDILTQRDEEKAVPRQTIFYSSHDDLPAYNVYKSRRVQELCFGITILIDAHKYFGDDKYLEYAKGATECLLSHYQKEDGHIEVDWGGSKEDYTTVCCPMIPILDMSNYLKDKDKAFAQRCFEAGEKMAEFLYLRGLHFPTEGGKSKESEEEMEDGSISCTALSLLYYAKNGKYNDKYIKKAKEILDIHECWVIKTPICQMHGSSLRWWETQWEGDANGPAICAGHAWSIWRGEADYLYYELTKDKSHLIKAQNAFMTNLAKIDKNGVSFAIYSPDDISGGGFTSSCEEIDFRPTIGFPRTPDSGLSRYAWIRINDTFLS